MINIAKNVALESFSEPDSREINFDNQAEVDHILRVLPYYFKRFEEFCEGKAVTLRKNGKILAIAGLIPTFMGSANLIFFASKDLQAGFDHHVAKAFWIFISTATLQYRRIQTTCLADDSKEAIRNRRFLEFFGFEKEGLMKKYGFDGEDVYMYSIVVD